MFAHGVPRDHPRDGSYQGLNGASEPAKPPPVENGGRWNSHYRPSTYHEDVMNGALADGSVRTFRLDMDCSIWTKTIRSGDGQVMERH